MPRCVVRSDNVIFESQCQAAKETGCDRSHIGKVCRGEEATAGGYGWSFGDPAPRHIKLAKYCVWTLSDESGVRFVGTGPTDDPLQAFKRVERAGLECGLGRWIDSLDTPPKFAVVLAGVDAVEADAASTKLIGQLPNLLNLPHGTRGGKGKSVVLIFQNGRVRLFPTQAAACRWLGVKWDGINFTGRVIRQRQRPGTAGRETVEHAATVRPEPSSHAAAARVNAADAAARVNAADAAARPGKNCTGARRKRSAAQFLSVLCLRSDHLGGIFAPDLADRNTAASEIMQKTT